MPSTSELGSFLRARREGLTPAEVGLPASVRRRTPGLRREEVATLAGVSIDYLVRLEQGRDTNPSAGVLAALADALRLTDEERAYLGTLSHLSNAQELCPTAMPSPTDVAPTLQAVVERLGTTPAFVLSPGNDVVAWNPAWARVAGPLGMLDGEPPNLVRHTFLDPRARSIHPDWAAAADAQVQQLRAAAVHWSWVPGFAALLAELEEVPEFARRWSAHTLAAKRRGRTHLLHPELGPLRFDVEALAAGEMGEQRLVTWLPADEATEAALAPAAPARLRVV
jgi:transcriptional regulator with XRE-family HTH domain